MIGIQNSPGSTLMTIADMSVITSEVKVDETDIVNVKLGQSAEVTIDAIPRKTFHGTVTEIGNNAIVRSTGVATSQQSSTSQEAKDFKVVVTLTGSAARPSARTVVDRKNHDRHSKQRAHVPIQALTVRPVPTWKLNLQINVRSRLLELLSIRTRTEGRSSRAYLWFATRKRNSSRSRLASRNHRYRSYQRHSGR